MLFRRQHVVYAFYAVTMTSPYVALAAMLPLFLLAKLLGKDRGFVTDVLYWSVAATIAAITVAICIICSALLITNTFFFPILIAWVESHLLKSTDRNSEGKVCVGTPLSDYRGNAVNISYT